MNYMYKTKMGLIWSLSQKPKIHLMGRSGIASVALDKSLGIFVLTSQK